MTDKNEFLNNTTVERSYARGAKLAKTETTIEVDGKECKLCFKFNLKRGLQTGAYKLKAWIKYKRQLEDETNNSD